MAEIILLIPNVMFCPIELEVIVYIYVCVYIYMKVYVCGQQVEVADCMQTLFRGNSLSSKIMAYCFRFYGQCYLCYLLAPLIWEMFQLEESRQSASYEIDPMRSADQSFVGRSVRIMF